MATDRNNQDGQPLVDSPTIPEPIVSRPLRKRAMSFFEDDDRLLAPGRALVNGTNSTINNSTYSNFGICELPATTNNIHGQATAYNIASESESDSDVETGITVSSASSIAENYNEKAKDWRQKPSRWKRFCEPFDRLSGRQKIFLRLLAVATAVTVAVAVGLALTCTSKGKSVV